MHRDVKPANILIEQPGERVFLTDFGVAKRSGLTTMTVAGARVGTADYCAPERISGHDVDGRADVYSLACVASTVSPDSRRTRGTRSWPSHTRT